MLYTNFSVIKARNSPNLGYPKAKITFSNLQVMGVVLTRGALLEFDGINFSIDSSNFANVVLNASGTDLLRVLYSNQSQFQGELINLTFNGIIASDSSSAIHLLPTASSSLGEGSRRLSSEGGSIINITDSQFFNISGQKGPALLLEDSSSAVTVAINGSSFNLTNATDREGAIWSNTSALSLDSCVFNSTTAGYSGDYLYVESQSSIIQLTNCSVDENKTLALSDLSFGPTELQFAVTSADSPIVYGVLAKNSSTLVPGPNGLSTNAIY